VVTPAWKIKSPDMNTTASTRDGSGNPAPIEPDLEFIEELERFGAEGFRKCYQCATCSASCSMSPEENPFPRKEMVWAKWGLKDRLLKDLDIWSCYYCGDCSKTCPLCVAPGEVMMALRRWATSRYDWTGLSRRLYTSRVWEIGALVFVALIVVALFYFSGAFTPERMVTTHVSVNTFAPVLWVHYADWGMAAVLSFFLLTNAFRMIRIHTAGENIPLSLFFSEIKTFLVQAMTQKRWRECDQRNTRWLKHFLLVTAYVAMFLLVMFFLSVFQVDTSERTWVSYLGYYITLILLYVTGDAMWSRLKKKEEIHKHSHESDWTFLILLFLTALTGILMHFFRIMNWPLSTYYMYVIHLAIAVPMLVVEVPFMKWAHLMYRPLALYLLAVKKKAREAEAS